MSNSASHAALPYPIKGARFTLQVPFLDASGVPTDPTTPDTEVSKDGGSFTDCTEEITTISGSNGWGYITLTGDETNCSMLALAAKVASGPNPTLIEVRPQVLRVIHSGTAQAGAAGTMTLAAGASDASVTAYAGLILKTTGGTGGGGGSGSLNNQARVITAYDPSTKIASVTPNWETNPDSSTTYEVLRPCAIGMAAADIQAIAGTSADAALLGAMAKSVILGTVTATGGTATTFQCSDITEASASHYVGKQVWCLSGTQAKQCLGVVTAYALTSGEGRFTVSPGSPTAEVMAAGVAVLIL
jgi:hypothetical protein